METPSRVTAFGPQGGGSSASCKRGTHAPGFGRIRADREGGGGGKQATRASGAAKTYVSEAIGDTPRGPNWILPRPDGLAVVYRPLGGCSYKIPDSLGVRAEGRVLPTVGRLGNKQIVRPER